MDREPIGEESKLKKQSTKKAIAKSRDLALSLAKILDAKKAENIDVLDLSKLTVVTDCFVIAAGFARVQIRALADEVLEAARAAGAEKKTLEGYDDSGWILIDLGDVIVHLMTHESRDFYRLDRLWGDAPRLWRPTDTNATNETEIE